jgi:small subunit ribosomal protein S6
MSSNRYEILLALDIAGKEESAREAVERLEKVLASEGAQVEQVQRLERREFAYPHQKLKSAYFVNYIVHAPAPAVARVRSKLSLDEEVLLQNYLRKSAPKPAGKARRAAKKTVKAA